jgi:hypothetical protein
LLYRRVVAEPAKRRVQLIEVLQGIGNPFSG